MIDLNEINKEEIKVITLKEFEKLNKAFRDSFYVTGELQDFYLTLRPELLKIFICF